MVEQISLARPDVGGNGAAEQMAGSAVSPLDLRSDDVQGVAIAIMLPPGQGEVIALEPGADNHPATTASGCPAISVLMQARHRSRLR